MEKVVTINDKEYPQLLKEIGDAPKKLYYKGNWSEEIFQNCLTVVGSRRMTSYGKQVVEQLVTKIAMAGITIVSGFMYGIDAASHRAALQVGGQTIAVMPCGIEIVHPAYQKKLYQDILDNGGLIISEFEKNFPPALWTYPKRNRIMAGLSKATLVIEAAFKSGTLITANFAKKYGRKVFAVPGPITGTNFQGINQLFKEGASMVSKAEDVLEYYNIQKQGLLAQRGTICLGKSGAFSLKNLEEKIIGELKREPLEIDDLVRILKVSASEIGTALSLLELKDLVSKQGNKYYLK